MTQIQTHITRGNLIESTHKSKCVIKNYNYKTVFSTKNNKDLVYPRSAIKILQAIPFIQSQAKNKYDLSQKQIEELFEETSKIPKDSRVETIIVSNGRIIERVYCSLDGERITVNCLEDL